MMAVIGLTWKEVLRKKVLMTTVLLTTVFLLLETLGAYGIKRASSISNHIELGQTLLATGLYFSNFVDAYLSIFSAAGTISTEIENGLLLSILPRAIPRWHIYVGKWIGYAMWSVLFASVMYWAQVLIVWWQIGYASIGTTVWMAFGDFLMIPLVLTSLSILSSTYLPTTGNGILLTLLFSLGLLGGILELAHLSAGFDSTSSTIANVGMVLSFLVPTDALYRRMTYDITNGSSAYGLSLGPFKTPMVPSHAFLIYVTVYICLLVVWGSIRFSKRDI